MNTSSLLPATRYAYGVSYEPSSPVAVLGRFRTFPPEGTPFNFTFAFASCQMRPDSPLFPELFDTAPNPIAFFLITGDLFCTRSQRRMLVLSCCPGTDADIERDVDSLFDAA